MKNSNLFYESRLVFRAEGPSKAPESVDKPKDTGKALEGMNMHQAEAMAKDKIARTAEAINTQLKKKPSENLKQLHKKLVDLSDKFEKKYENYNGNEEKVRAVVASTIEETNKLIDTKMPEVKAQIIDSSLGSLTEKGFSTHGRDQKWADSMVSAFSMMNSGETVSKKGVSFNRKGETLTVKEGNYEHVFKFQASNEGGVIKWNIYAQKGREKTNLQFADNPIDLGGDKYKAVETKTAEHIKENMPKAEPVKAEKPKEVVEKNETTKVAEFLKLIHEHTGATREVPNDLFKAFKNFTKDIAKNSTKAFSHEGVQAYVTSSKDGSAYRISTEIKGTPVVQYLEKNGLKIGTLARKKVEFKTDPIAQKLDEKALGEKTIASKVEGKPEGKKSKFVVDANEPKPTKADRERLGLTKETKEFSEQAKKWQEKLNKTLGKLVDTFRTFPSKVMDVAKAIMSQDPDKYKTQEARNGVYKTVSNLPGNLSNLWSSMDNKTPEETNKSLKGILSRLPGEGGKIVAEKYAIKPFEGPLYASLNQELPGKEAARTMGKPVVEYDLTDKPEVIKGNVKSYDFTDKPEVIKGNVKSYNLEEGEVLYGKIDNPLVKKDAVSHISKIIDNNTFVLRDVSKLKIHDVLDLPEGKTVSIQIKRKNGEVVTAVYDSEGKDKTYHITTPGKEEGKRVKIYDGDEVSIKSVNTYASKEEIAKGKKDKRIVAEYDLTDKPEKINAREEMIENNRSEMIKKLRALKSGEGMSFTTTDGKTINVYKARNEKGYYSVDENGKREKFNMTSVMTYSQLMGKDPNFKNLS